MNNEMSSNTSVHEGGDSGNEALTFERASDLLIEMARALMIENGTLEKRVYHTVEHPNTLDVRAGMVARIFNVSPEQRKLISIIIAWHDTTIKFDPADPEKITATIRRHRGARAGDQPSGEKGNEAESARQMKLAMRRMNERAGQTLFSEEQIKTAMLAVEATYPGIDFGENFQGAQFKNYPRYADVVAQNPRVGEIVDLLEREGVDKGPHFFQPHLEDPPERGERVPPEVLVMVLDDLGGAGMALEGEFALEGDKEFQELSTNIRDHLSRLLRGDQEKDETDRTEVAGAMVRWLKSQTGFVVWQMLRVEKIIFLLRKNEQITPAQAEQLHATFNKFEDNIKSSRKRAQRAEREYTERKEREGGRAAFRYLAQEMHYKVS